MRLKLEQLRADLAHFAGILLKQTVLCARLHRFSLILSEQSPGNCFLDLIFKQLSTKLLSDTQ